MPAADGSDDYVSAAARLNSLLSKPTLSGQGLRDAVVAKWGKSFDVRLHKRGGRMYLQVGLRQGQKGGSASFSGDATVFFVLQPAGCSKLL